MSTFTRQPSAARALFAEKDYRRLWVSGAVVGAGRWLEFLALGVFAYEVTASPPLVALVAIARMLPYVLCGVLVGALADHLDRKRMLAASFLAASLAFAAMSVIAVAGLAGYGTVLLAAVVSGLLWTTDMPLRRRLVVEAAGFARLAPALAFDHSTSFAARAIGPLVGGAVYQWLGIEGIFALSALAYFWCFVLAASLKTAAPPATDGGWRARPGVLALLLPPRELLASRRFLVFVGITVVFNVWCFPIVSMVPVFGEREFALSPTGIGALSACVGIGGTLGAIMVGMLARERPLFRIYYSGALGFLVIMLALSTKLTLAMAITGLLLIGVAEACYASTQYALVHTMSPSEVRGRATGFLTVFIGTSTLGFYNTGFLFDRFATENAMMLMALEGLVPLACLGLLWVRARS